MSVTATVHIVDDDEAMRTALQRILGKMDVDCRTYATAEEFLSAAGKANGCVVADVQLPDMDGITLVQTMESHGIDWPVLVMTGHADINLAVRAMKAGAVDFLAKPFARDVFVEKVHACLAIEQLRARRRERKRNAGLRLSSLSQREAQVLRLVIDGKQNKSIAWDLEISIKTVEVHRARIMEKTGSTSIIELVRLWEIADRDFGCSHAPPGKCNATERTLSADPAD